MAPSIIFTLKSFYILYFILSPTPLSPPLLPWPLPELHAPPLLPASPPAHFPAPFSTCRRAPRIRKYSAEHLRSHSSDSTAVWVAHIYRIIQVCSGGSDRMSCRSRPMSAPPLPLTSLGCLTRTCLLGPSSGPSSSLVRFLGVGLGLPTWHFAQAC